MTTSSEQITEATAALTAAADAYHGKKDEIDAALAASQAGYVALSADLKGVVNTTMNFTATVDPNAVDPNEVDGGTFNTIVAAINAAPYGSSVELFLTAGDTHTVEAFVILWGRRVYFRNSGSGDNPIIQLTAYESAGSNWVNGFSFGRGGQLFFINCDIRLPAKVNAGVGWNAQRCLVSYSEAGVALVSLSRSKVTGADGQGVANCTNGMTVILSMFSTELDGDIDGVYNAVAGVAIVSKASLTLSNGAGITDGGTLGTNVLYN